MQKIFYDNILGEINTNLILDNKIECVEYDEYQITEHVDVNAKKTFPAYEFIENNYVITDDDTAFDEENENNRYQIWNDVEVKFDNPCIMDNLEFRIKCLGYKTESSNAEELENVKIEVAESASLNENNFGNYYFIKERKPGSIKVNFKLITKKLEEDESIFIKENTIEVIANYYKGTPLTKYYPPDGPRVNVWKMPTNHLVNNTTTIRIKEPNKDSKSSDVEKNIPIGEYNAKKIYENYRNGRRTMSLSVVNREYIDVYTKIFVTKMKQSEYKALSETDTLDKADAEAIRQAISTDNNGRARVFLVTKNEEVYDGAYVQKLDLMEINEKLSS